MKIKKNIVFSILIDIFLSLLMYLVFCKDIFNFTDSLKSISIFSFIISITILFRAFIFNKNTFDFYKIFLVFYIIYIFGIVYLRQVFNYEVLEVTMYLDNLFNNSTLYYGVLYSTFSLIAINIGYSLFCVKNSSLNFRIDDIYGFDTNELLKKVAVFLFVFSVPFALYEFIRTIQLVLIYGYHGQIESATYGLFSIGSKIEPFFMISIYMLTVANKENKYKKNIYFCIGLSYSVALIFLGRRGLPLLKLLGLIIIYLSASKKINFKLVFKTFMILFCLTVFISIIRENRNIPLNDWKSNLSSLVIEKVKDNPINESIYEMGLGIYPISYSIQLVPNSIKPLYGITYIKSFINIFNIFGSDSFNKYNCGEIISNYKGYQFGASFIEEIYCNFQWFGLIFSMFIGYSIGLFSNKYNKQKNIIIKILMINIFIEFVWCIKNVLYNMPRIFVMYFVSIIIVNLFIKCSYEKRRSLI